MNNTGTTTTNQENQVKIIKPDFELKKKIGKDLDNILSEERTKAAEKVVDEEKADYQTEANTKISELRELYNSFHTAPVGEHLKIMEQMRFIALDIKSKAGMFDYGLATDISDSLHKFINKKPELNDNTKIIIKSHIDALNAVFLQGIKGHNNTMANALIKEFKSLSESK